MSRILINGMNSKTGGGKSILNNFLSLLKEHKQNNHYVILVPSKSEYEQYQCSYIEIIEVPSIYKQNMLFPFTNRFILPKLIRDFQINVVLNLADVPIPTNVPQLFLFDWSYAVYPDSTVWKMMDFKSYLIRKSKLYFFKKYLHYPKIIIAQTETMKNRLESIYGLKNIEVIPNAVSLENLDNGEAYEFRLPEGIKLLYLTYYYPHKNLEIFIPLAKEIKRKRLPYKLVTTIDATQHKGAKEFLDNVKKFALEDIIINIGPVDMKNVPSLYKKCDGLLMPTLLESFSGTYVEAMFHKIPIFTSDIDFAKGVCEESAFYFDPFNIDSILNSITFAFQNEKIMKNKIEEEARVLKKSLNWKQVFDKYQILINKLLEQKGKEL